MCTLLFNSFCSNVAKQVGCFCCPLGDSRKYPYHTMDSLKEFRGQGRESKGMGGDAYNWNSEGMVGGGGVDLEFPQGTDTECIP